MKKTYNCLDEDAMFTDFKSVVNGCLNMAYSGQKEIISFYFEDWAADSSDEEYPCHCGKPQCNCATKDGETLPTARAWLSYVKKHLRNTSARFQLKHNGCIIKQCLTMAKLISFLCNNPPIYRNNCYYIEMCEPVPTRFPLKKKIKK